MTTLRCLLVGDDSPQDSGGAVAAWIISALGVPKLYTLALLKGLGSTQRRPGHKHDGFTEPNQAVQP